MRQHRRAGRRAAVDGDHGYASRLGGAEAAGQTVDGAWADHHATDAARKRVLTAGQLHGIRILAVEREDADVSAFSRSGSRPIAHPGEDVEDPPGNRVAHS